MINELLLLCRNLASTLLNKIPMIGTGYWNEKKEKLKQRFPAITDDDLKFSDGKERVMLEILGYKLGKTKEELHRILIEL